MLGVVSLPTRGWCFHGPPPALAVSLATSGNRRESCYRLRASRRVMLGVRVYMYMCMYVYIYIYIYIYMVS